MGDDCFYFIQLNITITCYFVLCVFLITILHHRDDTMCSERMTVTTRWPMNEVKHRHVNVKKLKLRNGRARYFQTNCTFLPPLDLLNVVQ